MATTEQIIEHLRKLSNHKTRPEKYDDWNPYDASGGNSDVAYEMGTEDGEINLASEVIRALDNGTNLPDVPLPDDEDEDKDEE